MKVITYQPDNSLRKGYRSLFGDIVTEIIDNRWLTLQLFKRDFSALYKQSFIGILWAFIIPFISVGTFILLNRSGIFEIGDINVPYPIYALLGMAFWQLFAVGLITASNSLVKAGSMIVKINFSKKSLVFASAGQSIIPFLIQFLFVMILFIIYGIKPNIAVLLTPLLAIPIILFTVGLSLIFSLLNGIMRDIGNALSFIITFLMFLTPVLYAKPKIGILTPITKVNPLYYLISSPRELILMGRISEWRGYLIASIISIIVFVVYLVIFHVTETRVAERI